MISKNLLNKAGVPLVAFVLTVNGAHAQNVSDANDASVVTLEEIVVTAQRRSENLQQVPVAVTAFSDTALERSRIVDLQGIATRTPGFSMGEFNVGQPQLFIRGIGSNEDGAATDSSVVIFADGVYVGRAAGAALDIYDLARVEVLRGPQGTLYGKNVIGGAINVISNKPTDERRGRVEASVGNLGATRVRGFLSGALSDNVFGKISAQVNKRDGYVTSVVDGSDFQDRDDVSFRGALRFAPNDNFDLILSGEHARKRINGPGHHIIGGNIGNAHDAANFEASRSIYSTFADQPGFQERDVTAFSATAEWNLGATTLTSISAYRNTEYSFSDDVFGTNLNVFTVFDLIDGAVEEADQITQELRLTSNSEGRLSWITGLYYLEEDVDRVETFTVLSNAIPILAGDEVWDQENTTKSFSVFADFTYDLTDKLSLTAGLRYTDESKDARFIGTNGSLGFASVAENYDVSPSADFDETTPRFVLDYQANEDVLLYASATNGFKSGGFSGQNPTGESAALAFRPENAWAYELGAKTRLFDNRVQFNAAAFYTDYTDLQILLQRDPNAIGLTTINASDATTQGIEVEFVAQLTETFQLSGSYAYLDTEYENFLDPATGADLSGNTLRNAPKNSGSIAATYIRDIGSKGAELVMHYEHRYQSLAFQDIREQIEGAIPSYDIANAQVSIEYDNGVKWSLWVDNVWDEEFLIHNFPFAPNVAGDAIAGAPRTYGITFSYAL